MVYLKTVPAADCLAYIDGIILNELDITWSKVVVA
jgi:hypothetical protein